MIILDLIEHETIWGGHRLAPHTRDKRIGHLYSLITEDEMATRILNGPHAGETFRDYFQVHKAELGMSGYSEFPFVVALVEACDNLSIQVHPDDKTAQTLENQPFGKNESWLFLDTPADGWIFNGCTCNSNVQLRQRFDAMELDGLADILPVKPGDYVYVEAGTMHAMTRGCLVYEIEENCNLTYRVYDFDRKDARGRARELHIEKAFKAIDVAKKSVAKRYTDSQPITERRYSTELLRDISAFENTGVELACFTLIDGRFRLDGFEIIPGMSILVMPGVGFSCDVRTAVAARPRLI